MVAWCLRDQFGHLPSTLHPGLKFFLRQSARADWFAPTLDVWEWKLFSRTSRANYRDLKRIETDFWDSVPQID